LAIRPDAISALREIEPCFKTMTPELITTTIQGVAADLAKRLCEPCG
jgi:hypothetical protein